LLDKPGAEGVLEGLRDGHCFIGFDWIVDSSGFSFTWEAKGNFGIMGDDVPLADKPVLIARLPLAADLVLKKGGRAIRRLSSASLEYRPKAPGIYRLEAYLKVAGEKRPWIFSNPIRIF
jgi:hypothetical protein